MSCSRSLCTSGMLQKNWPESWKSCAITHENDPKRTHSRKCTCKPFWPGDIPLVLLCIKLWLVRGGGTVGVMKCIILASVCARNSRFQTHLNGSKKATMGTLGSKNQWKPRQMSSRRSLCTSEMLQKNWPESWKSCAITHENGPKRTHSRKRTCKPFWPSDIPLVLLCIKLWSVRCWRWKSVNLAKSLPSVLAWVLYLIHWY
jgi:hypothetical protein